MRVAWDPHPTFTRLPAYKTDSTPDEREAARQQMWRLYENCAAGLDRDYPMWPYEILTINHPPRELVEMAQERRDREGGTS